MANPEHLKVLTQGIDAWNRWRMENPKVIPELAGADLGGADLGAPQFPKGNRRWVRPLGLNLRGADLDGANLRAARLYRANLREALLNRADVRDAHLYKADLGRASLRDADFRGASLRGAKLRGSNLGGAILCGVDFMASDLSRANLDRADFSDSVMSGTSFGNTDLSPSTGLEKVVHRGPSTLGIDTIYRSQGNIPEVFLRGCGVPEDFIVYMRSLVAKPIEFYSCFISYSSQDDAFAQRLYADLQQKGVRCWFAPEDLKPGDKFRTRIDESIRTFDKLLVVLSKSSIQSPWVEEEVEAAIEKEHRQNKLVLFPIRLDDAVLETDQAWAASLRRTRHIGDFRPREDYDSYRKSFERLLRDLKADSPAAEPESQE